MRSLPTGFSVDEVWGAAEVPGLFLACRMAFSVPVRVWSGLGDLILDGETYTGLGSLAAVQPAEETSEIQANSIGLTLSSVPNEMIGLALAEDVHGRDCRIWLCGTYTTDSADLLLRAGASDALLARAGSDDKIVLSSNPAAVEESVWRIMLFRGRLDTMQIDEGDEESVLTIQVESNLAKLERTSPARYTDRYQKIAYPEDRGLEFIDALQNTSIVWGAEGNRTPRASTVE